MQSEEQSTTRADAGVVLRSSGDAGGAATSQAEAEATPEGVYAATSTLAAAWLQTTAETAVGTDSGALAVSGMHRR